MDSETRVRPEGSAIILHPDDNVATALCDLACGTTLTLPDGTVLQTIEAIPFGYKVALRAIDAGEHVLKYGVPIGVAVWGISRGEKIHTHNLRTLQGGAVT